MNKPKLLIARLLKKILKKIYGIKGYMPIVTIKIANDNMEFIDEVKFNIDPFDERQERTYVTIYNENSGELKAFSYTYDPEKNITSMDVFDSEAEFSILKTLGKRTDNN